jgi:hypothetical protein
MLALREYASRFVRSWWAGIGLVGGALGLFASLFGLDIPTWSWRGVVVFAIVVAGFRVFDDVCGERDAARAELAARDEGTGQPAQLSFEPRILEGRLFPSSDYVVVDSAERALVIRVAYALLTDDPQLDSDAQRGFEDAVAASALESLILEETTHLRRAGGDHWWRRTRPTRSSVVTVRRPRASTVSGDYDIEGQAVLNLHPAHTPWPTGWLLLVADVVVRPIKDDAGHAFTFQSLFAAAEVVVRALVDEIAPAVMERVAPDATPYSLTLLLQPQGMSLSEVVAFDWNDWDRAEDMGDAAGGQWFAPSAQVVADSRSRQEDLRRWFGRLLADSGYSGYEQDLGALVPVALPSPPAT